MPRILLLGYDEIAMPALAARLEAWGAIVLQTRVAARALYALSRARFDVLIILPGAGDAVDEPFELMHQARERSAGTSIWAALDAFHEPLRSAYLKAGAEGILTLPLGEAARSGLFA